MKVPSWQLKVLGVIIENASQGKTPLSYQAIADRLGWKARSGVCAAIKELEEKNLIRREKRKFYTAVPCVKVNKL